jgi:DNA-binding LacI/PurR family transcriptional regulator
VTSRPKLNEVADLAGVSLATVSRVLNGKQGVANPTRERVLEVLADLGYRDVPVRGVTNGVVGIITPELDNPIFPLIAQTIEARLAREGLLAMICSATSATVNEQEYLGHFLDSGAAGLVIINGRYSASDIGYGPYLDLAEKIPTVLVNGVGLGCPLPAVAVDIVAGGAMAVRHLASLGHHRIGCLVGPRRYNSTTQLIDGFGQGMEQSDLAIDDEFISETMFTIEGGRAGAVKLIEANVTAIVCGGDLMAIGAVSGLRSWGYSVPKDVSVVGFDGTTLVNYTDPSLTSVRQPVERMAQTVAWMLMSPPADGPNVHMFEPDLVIGSSTGRAP